mmetsp:Transcript_53181/g.108493  ORF Transcript_53181/g.108493 Transcript_53181/m.108493 type:complete len:610 (+) Transcript_53181:346-2175(+)|eukprot:CAMPEP_0181300552 /NCGR_PEP_ID=MMETSP1101-20121128/6950_1 /TAXON_ID=46948 /ORGANISM="Rhodomonas abbreviata, Strain Caron Lab Isolate" /LENGTH=609 /DNA_ID=CAMNT_0023405795 /DNA_START=346 /DNA_END=2175 /DNA_ORIENTATION=-
MFVLRLLPPTVVIATLFALTINIGLLVSAQDHFYRCHYNVEGAEGSGTDRTKVCCRATNNTICDQPSGRYLLDDVQVVSELHVHLEPYRLEPELGEESEFGENLGLCPNGVIEDGFLCVMDCWEESSLSTTVYHSLKSVNTPFMVSSCEDCCVLSYSENPRMPCNDLGCHVRTDYYDECPGSACHFASVPFSWRWMDTLSLTIAAPANQMYAWRPSHGGTLVISYLIRWEVHRQACCPPGQPTCCGNRRDRSICNGPEECVGGGRCSAKCECPYGDEELYQQREGSNVSCWTAVGQREKDYCSMFKATYEVTDDMLELSHVSGWGSNVSRPLTILKNKLGPSTLTVTGAGMVLEVHLGAPVQRFETYSLASTTFNLFNPRTTQKALACFDTQELLMKPTVMQMRSFVKAWDDTVYSRAPNRFNGANAKMEIRDSCKVHSNCSVCVNFLFNEIQCEWEPHNQRCVEAGSSSEVVSRVCDRALPTLPESGNDGVQVSSSASLAVIMGVVAIVLGVIYNVWLSRNTAYWDSMGTGLDQSATLHYHEATYEEKRRGDERLLPDLPLEREPGGELSYHKEVMAERLKDPNMPPHMMDSITAKQHLRMYGATCNP